MTSIHNLKPYLPDLWIKALERLPVSRWERVQEVRLRGGQAVTLSTPQGEMFLGTSGVTNTPNRDTFYCTEEQLERCFIRMCDDSVYAHEWELQQGYVAVSGGIRVGVAATAVLEGNRVRALRDVTALCIRLPRRFPACSAPLRRRMLAAGYPVNTLLVGPPSAGKTTLLRDLAVCLAAEGYRVTVVDERGELSGLCSMTGCEVLLGYPKAVGMGQAVRCLAPDVIVFDELGDEREAAAVCACARAGVAVVASLHGHTPAALSRQPLVRHLAQSRAFDLWAFMAGRREPGVVREYGRAEVENDTLYWVSADCVGRHGNGLLRSGAVAEADSIPAAVPAPVESIGEPLALHRSSVTGSVAAVGSGYRV